MRKKRHEQYNKSDGWLGVYLTLYAFGLTSWLAIEIVKFAFPASYFSIIMLSLRAVLFAVLLINFFLLEFTRKKLAVKFNLALLLVGLGTGVSLSWIAPILLVLLIVGIGTGLTLSWMPAALSGYMMITPPILLVIAFPTYLWYRYLTRKKFSLIFHLSLLSLLIGAWIAFSVYPKAAEAVMTSPALFKLSLFSLLILPSYIWYRYFKIAKRVKAIYTR